MAAATDQQMQQFANERVRPRAEQFRDLLASCRDDRDAIDDIYARAVSNSRWNDSRSDGPPHLLQSGNSASPDDMLNFNSFIGALLDIIDGVGTDATNAATLRDNWAVLVDACVRPVE